MIAGVDVTVAVVAVLVVLHGIVLFFHRSVLLLRACSYSSFLCLHYGFTFYFIILIYLFYHFK